MTWADFHTQSEQLAIAAQLAMRARNTGHALDLYGQAAAAERLALDQLDESKVRTRGITAVSAVALWFKARKYALAEQLAHALHLSVRTLHRHLHDEGATLQALKDEARREQAMAWLARSQRPIKQVAQAVGFASEKSFARAFRTWTGQTPSAYRRLRSMRVRGRIAAR